MICFPNAKINIGLHVIEKRDDGFHNIETVFYPVQWCDALEVVSSEFGVRSGKEDKIKFSLSGLEVEGDVKNNLVVKAYSLLDADFDLPPVHFHLHKNIPMGAGLGGGSADGAFALKLLNSTFDLKLSFDKLKMYAAKLGSDCSFFIENTATYATGKGDQLEKMELDLSKYHIVIVKPPAHVSTAEAYVGVKPSKLNQPLKELIKLPIAAWKENIKNDFEESVIEKFPVVKEVKEKLYAHGALYASMSGSGSAVYGIFDKEIKIEKEFEDCTSFFTAL